MAAIALSLHISVADDCVVLPSLVKDEVAFWAFFDASFEPVPFLLQQHISFRLHTDASGFGWGAYVSLPSGPLELRLLELLTITI